MLLSTVWVVYVQLWFSAKNTGELKYKDQKPTLVLARSTILYKANAF